MTTKNFREAKTQRMVGLELRYWAMLEEISMFFHWRPNKAISACIQKMHDHYLEKQKEQAQNAKQEAIDTIREQTKK